MATNFPSSLDTSTQQPTIASTDEMDDSGKEHDVVHTNHSGAIIALETKLGSTDSNPSANAVLMGTGSGTSAWDTSPTFKGAVTVGENDTGHDVKFFGATDGKYFEWDESADRVNIEGTLRLANHTSDNFPDASLICGSDSDVTPDAHFNAHFVVDGNGYAGGISLDANGMWVGHNSPGRDLYLATDETVRMIVARDGKTAIRDDSAASTIGARLLTLRSQTSGMIPLLAWAEQDVDAGTVIASIFMCGSTGDSSNLSSGDYWALFRRGNGSNAGYIRGTGSLSITYGSASDKTLKNDLGDAGDVSSIIDAINVRKFTWKDENDPGRVEIGLFAQDILALQENTMLPLSIATSANTLKEGTGKFDSEDNEIFEEQYIPAAIDYGKFTPLLIQEIKSLRQRVATLEG